MLGIKYRNIIHKHKNVKELEGYKNVLHFRNLLTYEVSTSAIKV